MQVEILLTLACKQLKKEKKMIDFDNLDNYMMRIANFVHSCPKRLLQKIISGATITKFDKYNLKKRKGIKL